MCWRPADHSSQSPTETSLHLRQIDCPALHATATACGLCSLCQQACQTYCCDGRYCSELGRREVTRPRHPLQPSTPLWMAVTAVQGWRMARSRAQHGEEAQGCQHSRGVATLIGQHPLVALALLRQHGRALPERACHQGILLLC